MKKLLLFIVLFLITFLGNFVSVHIAFAQSGVQSYTPLAPIPNFVDSPVSVTNLTAYLNGMFKLGIAIAGALAVIMIIVGGIQYMSTDSIGAKSDGKKRIIAAITGLLVALGSYMLLNTLSPDLLKTDLGLQPATIAAVAITPGSANYPYQPGDANYGTIVGADGQPVPGTHGGSYAGVGPGTVGSLSQSGTTFPDQGWNDYALQQINESGLANLSPTDISNYCPGGASDQCYLNILASIAGKESGFNPNNTYFETDPKLQYNSVGLLQLSTADSVVNNLGYSEQDLMNPYDNIYAGVQILKNQIESGGCISCQNSNGKWIGGSAYWSTLRPSSPGGG